MQTASTVASKAARVVIFITFTLIFTPSMWAQSPLVLSGGGSVVSFPAAPVGQSAASTVTVQATAPLTVASILANGDFTVTSDSCSLPASLGPGDSCVLDVTFTPTIAGSDWSSLLIADNNGVKYSFGLVGTGNGPVLTFTPGIVSTTAGNGTAGYSGDGGTALSAELNYPMGVTRDNVGNVYIADYVNNVIRKVDADGNIQTLAGNGTFGYSGDGGAATSAQLAFPSDVALDSAGNLYIADFLNSCVRKVDVNGIISTFATGFLVRGVTTDAAGNIYYSSSNEGVWKVDTNGVNTRVAGNGTPGFSGDGGPAINAQTSGVAGLAVDSQGNLYFAEVANSDVRKVDTNGIITTVAGNQQVGYSGDGGPATSAEFNGPSDVKLDAAGNLYISDSSNNRIRKVDASGTISSIAGGNYGYSGDGGLASDADFAGPEAIALDGNGNLLIADTGNSVIREVTVSSTTLDFGVVTVGQTGGPIGVTISNSGNQTLNVTELVVAGDFSAQSTCSDSGVPAGASCPLSASFTPTVNGDLVGTVTLTDNAQGSPHVVNLKGQGYMVPVASQLVFVTEFGVVPANGNLGSVVVNADDSRGNLVTGFTAAVGLQIQGPAGFQTFNAQVTASGGVATFNLSSLIFTVPGAYTITASSSGLSSAQAQFSVTGAKDFAVAVSSSLTVGKAASGTVNVTVTPMNGFTGTITLSCSGLPSHSSCSFAPLSLNADGSNTQLTSVMTITTGVTTNAANADPTPLSAVSRQLIGLGLLGFVFAPFVPVQRSSKKALKIAALIVLAVLCCLAMIGCQSVANGNHNPVVQTPAGSYTITVTAASTSISHSSTFTLTVQ